MNAAPPVVAAAIAGLAAIACAATALPFEARIAAQRTELERRTADAARERAAAQRLPALAAERAQLAATVRRLHPAANVPADRLLALAAGAAHSGGAELTAFAAPAAGGFDITLRGRFAAVLATLRSLIDAPLAIDLHLRSIAPESGRRTGAPALSAVIHIEVVGGTP